MDSDTEEVGPVFRAFALISVILFGVAVLGSAAVMFGYLFGLGDQVDGVLDGVVSGWQVVQGWYYWLTA